MGATIGTMYVRRSGFVQANPDRVWEEFTSLDRLRGWFGSGHTLHTYEPEVGAVVELSGELDGVRQHIGGPITVLEPSREVTFECDWHDPSLAWGVAMSWTLRLTPLYDGTTVEILHHGFERLGTDGGAALEGFEDGWGNLHLKTLRTLVER
jgi:uncharacterized protein YndB with AHSA1/START domain